MVILKRQTRVKWTLPPLTTYVWGVQNTQDHFMGPHWTKVLPGSDTRISERRTQLQAKDAPLGRPRSTRRASRHTSRTSSRKSPRERSRTAQFQELASQDRGERATDVPQATTNRSNTPARHTHTPDAPVQSVRRATRHNARQRAQLRANVSEPPDIMGWLHRAGARELPRDRWRALEEHQAKAKSKTDL